jgi:phosphoglycolate phosphatase
MIEHLRQGASATNARVALFDFDGTISVIRSGWMEITLPMMVEILMDFKTGEREEDLRTIIEVLPKVA